MTDELAAFLRNVERLDALRESGLLAPTESQALNRLTRLAARLLDTPLALVNVVDDRQQFSKSRVAPVGWPEDRSASLQDSFCKYTAFAREPLVVTDARTHPLLASSAMVTDLGVSAYAAVPLITHDGHALGTLCVADFVPRTWQPDQVELLRELAYSVLTEIELHRDIVKRARVEEELRQREEELRLIVESAHDAFVMMNQEGQITAWNLRAEQTFGWAREEVLGLVLSEVLIPPGDRVRHNQGLARYLQTGKGPLLDKRVELLALHREGHILPIELTVTPIQLGDQVAFSAFLRDISGRKQIEANIERYTATLRLLQRLATAANESGRFEDIAQQSVDAICAFTGWPLGHAYRVDENGTLIPTNIWTHDSTGDHAALRHDTTLTVMSAGEGLPGRVLMSGRPVWVVDLQLDSSVVRGSLKQGSDLHAAFAFPVLVGTEIVAVLEFFSHEVQEPDEALLDLMTNIGTQIGRVVERERTEARLRADALLDAATGLSNRLGFMTLAEQQLTLARRMRQEVALFFIDLDGLKPINDTLGHQWGDRAIAELAQLLRQTFRASDIIARLGGDEFVIFALDVPQGSIPPMLARLDQHLAALNRAPGRPYLLRMSIGVALRPAQQVDSLQELVDEADRRMYEQKQAKPSRRDGVLLLP